MNAPVDAQARAAAISPHTSFAVSAPAGSGKTGLLTLRVLGLLSVCDTPEEILCITFTRKAAQEMKERIITALEQAEGLSKNEIESIADPHQQQLLFLAKTACENSRSRHWNLLSTPHRLKIQTIDSFCGSLVQQMPMMSAVGGKAQLLEDPSVAYDQAAQSLIENCSSNAWPEALQTLYTHLNCDIDRVARLLSGLLHARDQWLPLVYKLTGNLSGNEHDDLKQQLESNLAAWAENILEELGSALKVYESELCELLDFAGSNLTEILPHSEGAKLKGVTAFPAETCLESGLTTFWKPLTSVTLTAKHEFLKRLTKNHGFPPGDKQQKALFTQQKKRFQELIAEISSIDGVRDNLELVAIFPNLHYSTVQWGALRALFDLLPLLVAHLKLVFQQQGSVDFIDVAERAKAALGSYSDVSDLALRLDYSLKHILVDEFQDTSHSQLELLRLLLREWEYDDSKTLFVVGDGMQSCYGFRNADVGIFLDVRQNGLGGKSCTKADLDVNFRSTDTIIQWVNKHFQGAFPATDNIGRGAVRYTASQAFTPSKGESQSYTKCVGFTDDEDGLIEAAYVADQVQHLIQQDPTQSIAILVRSRNHLIHILPALNLHGVPYSAVEIDPMQSRPWIQHLYALTRVLENPSDNVAWLTLIRAPWCGIDNFDLSTLFSRDCSEPNSSDTKGLGNKGLDAKRADSKYSSVVSKIQRAITELRLSGDGHHCLARFYQALHSSLAMISRRSTRELVEATWLKLGGAELISSESQRKDTDGYLALLSKHCEGGKIVDRQLFDRAFEKLYAQPEITPGAVQVMTMHKSKGLEFDTVFLPNLHKHSRPDAPALLYWHERQLANDRASLLLSPIAASTETEADPLTALLRNEAKRRSEYEETRLFYVACTRARARLFLSGQLKLDKDEQPVMPARSSFLSRIWQTAGAEFIVESAVHIEEAANKVPRTRIRTYIERLPITFKPLSIVSKNRELWTLPDYDNQAAELTLLAFESSANSRVRALGTVLHRSLKMLHDNGASQAFVSSLSALTDYWRAQLQQLGLTEEMALGCCDSMAETLEAVLTSETGLWLLNNRHRDSHCELRLSYGDTAKIAVVDRTFIDSNNVRWIVDYKTSSPAAGEDLQVFITAAKALYREQVEFYLTLLRERDSLAQHRDISEYRCALYFPTIDYLALYADIP